MEGVGALNRNPPAAAGEKRGIILSAVPVGRALARYIAPGDCIVACDAGYRNAATLGVTPDLIVGDFDSAPRPRQTPGGKETIVLPHVKNDTDTHYAARWLVEHGCTHVTLLGALGGARFEHSIANLHTMLWLAEQGVTPLMADEHSELRILSPGRPLTLERGDWAYLSLFPLDGPLTGVDIEGAYYPLANATLTPDYPLGVSNEFAAPTATLRCAGGHGLVVLSRSDAEKAP